LQTKEKYTVISATNRRDNRTLQFAELSRNELKAMGLEVELFSLEEIPENFKIQHIYDHNDSPISSIVDKYIIPSQKFIIIAPEYNGSYPGVLKVFIDSIPPDYFRGKKALLIGTSSGRAGNLRGMDHLAAVLNYLKVEVYSQKLPISSINRLMNPEGQIVDDNTRDLISGLISDFQQF